MASIRTAKTPVEYNQLRALVAIAQHGSIRAAAKTVCLSQPALTKAIHELEQELGVPLVTRSARGAQLDSFVEAVTSGAAFSIRHRSCGRRMSSPRAAIMHQCDAARLMRWKLRSK
jgi:DNA-binding transcriptional LysR family regulator